MKPAVLITGVAGMIGYHVAIRLLPNFHVVGLDDLSGGSRTMPADIHFYEGSCLDAKKLDKIINAHSPSFIIHCAAMAAENLSHNCRIFTYHNNLVGEATVRNAAVNHDVECMVSLSSIAVMGHQPPPFSEAHLPSPCDPYGISKYAGELDAKAAKEFFGLNYLILRPQNVIGTRQNMADRYRNVAAILIRYGLEGKPMPIFGNGEQTRAFTPVSHAVAVIEAALQRRNHWNQIYNVASKDILTVLSLAKTICRLMKIEEKFMFLEERKEAKHAHLDTTKCDLDFGDVYPNESVETALSAMIDEARSMPIPTMQKGPDIEIERGLPSFWTSGSP